MQDARKVGLIILSILLLLLYSILIIVVSGGNGDFVALAIVLGFPITVALYKFFDSVLD